MQNVRFTSSKEPQSPFAEDDVFVNTAGRIQFRMWDVQTGQPENVKKETLKRMFGCSRRHPETTVNWDFLLEE